MRFLTLAPLLALSAVAVLAQESQQYLACNAKAKAQPELNACADQEVARVDAELNAIYAKVLAAAADDPKAVVKIKAAERAWVAYRDAYLDAMYPAEDKQAEYGSIYPMDVALLRAKLTRQQVAALKDLLGQYSE